MTDLSILLFIVFAGSILTYLAFRFNKSVGNIMVSLVAAILPAYFFTMEAGDFSLDVLGLTLKFGFTSYSWLFALLVVVLASLALFYSIPYMKGKHNLGWFYLNFMLSIGGMLGILMSKDFVSLFIFWEIMTWSSYLIVIYNGNDVNKVGLKYMVFSAIGAYAMLMSIVLINKLTGSTDIAVYFNAFGSLSVGEQILTSVLLLLGFGVKSALMPLHVWAPGAYSNAPMSYTAMFSGALSKMGIYGMGFVALNLFEKANIPLAGEILAWLGAITAVLATFYAVFQNDIRKMLAWSSVGQLGYIAVGLGIGTELSVFAGLYLAFLHGMFKGVLFMAVGAVERQAGSTDMYVIRGLIRKMPLTFFSALIAVIALAGVPPIGGFVGKWMLYESMITSNHIFLIILIFLSSTAAFLYSFRFLYGIFLGQEEPEFENVKEAPFLMSAPMLLMALFLLATGTFPGIIFDPIAKAMSGLGFDNVSWQMSILTNEWSNSVNLQHVTTMFGAVFVIFLIFITWIGYKRTKVVSTKDIANAGEPVRDEDNYHYALDFFKPFERVIWPAMKYSMDKIYMTFAKGFEDFFQFMRRIYTGNGQTYAIYVIAFLALMLIIGKYILL